MSATIVRDRRQITLPAEVCEPAQIDVGDQVDWRFEGGEIRGRKLQPAENPRRAAKLVQDSKTGRFYFDTPISDEEMEAAALNANIDRCQ